MTAYPDVLTVVVAWAAAASVVCGGLAAIVCLQWSRIARLGARIRQWNEDRADLLAANRELGDTIEVLRAKVNELTEAREQAT